MTDPLADIDYWALTDTQLSSCIERVEAVRQDRRLIATEDEFAAIHEQAAADALESAHRIRADAAAARLRRGVHDNDQEGI